MHHYWLLLLLLFAADAQSSTTALSREQLSSSDLKRQFPDSEITELSITDGSFILLQREAMTRAVKGTAILVPDSSEHAASPKHLGLLREQLNDLGWHTLSIMPPDALLSDSGVPVVDARQLKIRTEAAMQHAARQAGATIVIAQGDSAATLTTLYAAGDLTEPVALILLGAYLSDDALNRQLAQAIATQSIPTLDISHTLDSRLVNQQLKLRRQMAEKHLKAVYRQRHVTGSGYDAEIQQWVMKEIYGWLTSVGF
ncbi:DUF3530 family protein [Chromatiaceae bacterium AAb-1]|nr:DUF3530 family protein [Chromatiaceae bacterium AAb-1]